MFGSKSALMSVRRGQLTDRGNRCRETAFRPASPSVDSTVCVSRQRPLSTSAGGFRISGGSRGASLRARLRPSSCRLLPVTVDPPRRVSSGCAVFPPSLGGLVFVLRSGARAPAGKRARDVGEGGAADRPITGGLTVNTARPGPAHVLTASRQPHFTPFSLRWKNYRTRRKAPSRRPDAFRPVLSFLQPRCCSVNLIPIPRFSSPSCLAQRPRQHRRRVLGGRRYYATAAAMI